jgi:hypothetical protein
MTADWTQNLRLLKVIVAVLTTLIVIALVLLVWGMARTAGRMSDRAATAPKTHALPPGATLVSTSLADDRVLLHLRRDGRDVLQVIDLASGKLVRELTLEAAP